jgi:hypothetical protein
MGKLSDETRETLKEIIHEYLMDQALDLTPEELVENGFKALWEYTDEDLIQEIEDNFFDEDDEEEDEDDEMRTLIKKAKAELE